MKNSETGAASLIDYPCAFAIKVMGRRDAALLPEMAAIAVQHDPGFDTASITQRHSSGGNYVGLTLTVTATSRAQLDDLYRAFSSHRLVKVVL